MTSTFITFARPDEETSAALGRLVVMQGQLDHVLKMTVKSLSGMSIRDALISMHGKSGEKLRKKILTLAKEKLGEGEAFDLLSSLIDRAWQAAIKRNQFVHNVWARPNGWGWNNYNPLLLQNDNLTWREAPTKGEIEELTYEISNILATLNDARLEGVIAKTSTEDHLKIVPAEK